MLVNTQRDGAGHRRLRFGKTKQHSAVWRHESEAALRPAPVETLDVVVHGRRRFLRDGVAILLGGETCIDVIATTHRASELVQTCVDTMPDVVVLYVDLLDVDLIETVGDIRDAVPGVRVIAVGSRVHAEQWRVARASGIDEIVAASDGVDVLAAAVRGTNSTATPAADP